MSAPVDIMSAEFRTVTPTSYTAAPRDPRDSDRAARVYASMDRIRTEHQYAMIDEDGNYHEDTSGELHAVTEDTPDDERPELPGVLIDASTAGLVRQIADAVNDAHRAQFLGMPIPAMGRLAWRLAS